MNYIVKFILTAAIGLSLGFSGLSAQAAPPTQEIDNIFSSLQTQGIEFTRETLTNFKKQWPKIYTKLESILTSEQLKILQAHLQQGSEPAVIVAQMNLSSQQKVQLTQLLLVYNLMPSSLKNTPEIAIGVPEPSSNIGLLVIAVIGLGFAVKYRPKIS